MAGTWGKKAQNTESHSEEYNIVTNLTLKCWELTQDENRLRLRCGFGGGKRKEGEGYKKEIPVTVWVDLNECEIEEKDYEKSIIAVCGRMSATEWTDKEGNVRTNLNINATKVVSRNFE